MTALELDAYFRSVLKIKDFQKIDSSLNGLQVDGGGGADIKKIAFAVDACMETFLQAYAINAGMVFAHHGLFWGGATALTGIQGGRVKFLMDKNIALYAAHLPLDENAEVGNNACLARLLELKDVRPFGFYKGVQIGFKGVFERPVTINEAALRVSFMGREAAAVLPFGPKENKTCAVISGGASMEAVQAVEEGVDLYVTGEALHSVYHIALEGRLNMIGGGHYATEVWGVRALAEKCEKETGIECVFLDVPTGL
ncbi:MAG: Nif3-like dinuclear metal center hexameric protein [Spirochaetaceae bacterium]|jgi:dinuclear metal center YbgI/SA1388 family protein|nr:Nif3-like dinuclear metal center hexameric protein [Spirochaetaceae bacterium]